MAAAVARSLAVSLLLVPCATARARDASKGAGNGVRDAHPVISLFRSGSAWGWSPEYRLTLFADGGVRYQGSLFVKTRGACSAKLAKQTIERLLEAARDASFFTWAASRPHCDIVDAGATTLSLYDLKQRKVVTAEVCKRDPSLEFFWKLAQAVDDAVQVERWIGTAAERAPLVADSENERDRAFREKFDWNKPAATCPP